MVTAPITTIQGFDTYYGTQKASNNNTQNGVDTTTVVLITGLVLVSALTVYYAIENNDLRKKIKKFDAKRFEIN